MQILINPWYPPFDYIFILYSSCLQNFQKIQRSINHIFKFQLTIVEYCMIIRVYGGMDCVFYLCYSRDILLCVAKYIFKGFVGDNDKF